PEGRGYLLPVATAVLAPADISWWLNDGPRTTREADIRLQGNWESLVADHTWLRVVKKHQLISEPEDYFDEFIIHFSGYRWTPTRRIAAQVMNAVYESGHFMDDKFIFWRMRHLVEAGVIACICDPDAPRDRSISSKDMHFRNQIGPFLSFRTRRFPDDVKGALVAR